LIASVLLVQGLLFFGMAMLQPMTEPLSQGLQDWATRIQLESVRDRMDLLTRLEFEAADPAEKSKATKAIDAYLAEVQLRVNPIKLGFAGSNNPAVKIYTWVDAIAGVVLNTFLIVAAAGLAGLREWGRKLVVVVAGLKLTRIGLFTVAMLGWVLPVQLRAMKAAMGPAINGPKGNAAAGVASEMLAAASTGGVIGWAILASIFPILLIVMLSKARVRAACRQANSSSLSEPL
jgi:hypothetical protein